MSTANYTVAALYAYDSSIFDGLNVPSTINKDKVVSNILMESAPFETLYTDPDELKLYITVWSDASQERWNRWAEAWVQAAEFNPLENKDITIKETLTKDGKDITTDTMNYGRTDTGSVSAYDSVSYNPHDKTELGGEDTRTVTGEFEDRTDTRDVHEHGNIGVTSLAQLITSFDEAVDKLDTYDKITADFIRQFCIMVY